MPVTVVNVGAPLDGKSIGQWVKEATIRAAETALRAEVARGFDNKPVVVTDGMPRRDYNAVKPFGRIEFIRRPQMAEAVLWALDMLRKRSPVLTGRYVQSHVVMVNGVEVQGDLRQALMGVKPSDRVQIVNTQPYAKKIEGRASSKKRGISGARGLSSQAPGGVYRVVARLLVQRYGRSMFFDHKFVKIEGGYKLSRTHTRNRRLSLTGQRVTTSRRMQRDLVYPALQLFIKPTGAAN